jgi:uncharacterized protein (TIGR02246 family)
LATAISPRRQNPPALIIARPFTRNKFPITRAVPGHRKIASIALNCAKSNPVHPHSTWIDAVNAGDLDRLLSLMADDAVFLSPGRAPVGRDEFSAHFSAAQKQARIGCVSELEEVVVVGAGEAMQVAYTRSRDALSVTPIPDPAATPPAATQPQAIHLAGHRLTIYRKQPDGSWLLARDAHTLATAAAP